MNNNNSVVQFEIDHPISRLVRFERVFQRTSICILIAYVLTSIYYTMNFSYSIYYMSKLGCQKIRILYLLNIISDILFWAATAILYLAIKYTSIRRFQKYNYTIYSLIIIRLAYAFNLLVMEEGLTEEDATDCKFTSHEKIKKILFYLVENLFYVITVGTVHYLISILTNIKEQPKDLLTHDVKESLII
ncbi:unnamed protein product [Paramecium octaurelia]|nr:unnamed protein product [Paramecium octaurelia]